MECCICIKVHDAWWIHYCTGRDRLLVWYSFLRTFVGKHTLHSLIEYISLVTENFYQEMSSMLVGMYWGCTCILNTPLQRTVLLSQPFPLNKEHLLWIVFATFHCIIVYTLYSSCHTITSGSPSPYTHTHSQGWPVPSQYRHIPTLMRWSHSGTDRLMFSWAPLITPHLWTCGKIIIKLMTISI